MVAERTDTRSRMMSGGSLERTPLAEVVRTIYRERATAKLLVSARGEERTFWFDRGQILSVSSNREAQLVGDLLRTFGLAEESLLMSAFEKALAEPGQGLARALTQSGAVADYVAEAAVRALSERLFFDTFRWTTGVFAVTPLESTPVVPARADRPTGGLLLEALRRLPSPAAQLNSPLSPSARPVFAPDLLLRYQAFTVSAAEAEVLGRIDGSLTVEQIHPDHRVVARLAATGLVHLVAPGRTAEKSGAPEGLLFLNVEIAGAAPPPRIAEQLESQREIVWNTYRRLDWASLYDVLGVEPDVAPDDLVRAFHERARMFHPDLHLKSHLSDAREALEALFAKVRDAEREFRTPEARAQYDRTLAGARGYRRPSRQCTHRRGPEGDRAQELHARQGSLRRGGLPSGLRDDPAGRRVRPRAEGVLDPPLRIQRKNPKWIRQATETMRRAVKRMPDSVDLWWELAEACAQERNESERIKALKEVMRLDPVNRRAQTGSRGDQREGATLR